MDNRPATPPQIPPSASGDKLAAGGIFQAIADLDLASALDGKARKDGGVVYTPKAIAMRMCALASPALSDKVLEPSCGRGVFVFALAEHHLARGTAASECARALGENLSACELDPAAAADLAMLWTSYWADKGVDAPPLRIKSEDSLFAGFSKEAFDLVLGNPPYVRFQNLPAAYRKDLQGTYPACASGNVDLYFAFVEQALRQAKRCCLITPNSWMASSSGQALRALLAPRMEKLIDYGDALVFDPVRAYCCVMLARAEPTAQPLALSHGGQAIKAAKAAAARGGPEPAEIPAAWETIDRSDPRLSEKAWRIREDAPDAAPHGAHPGSSRPRAPSKLSDLCQISTGIATLADSCYGLRGSPGPDGIVSFFDEACGRTLRIDVALCPIKAKITKCASEADIAGSQERILRPYLGGALIPEAKLAKEHPDALAFLLARKDRLALRDKGKQEKYEAWHAYGRKQGLRPLPAGALIAMPVMSNHGLRCFELDTARTGDFLFTSGFILAPKPGVAAQRILAALSSPKSWAWILSRGKQWAGKEGDAYMTYGAKLIAELPIPDEASKA